MFAVAKERCQMLPKMRLTMTCGEKQWVVARKGTTWASEQAIDVASISNLKMFLSWKP